MPPVNRGSREIRSVAVATGRRLGRPCRIFISLTMNLIRTWRFSKCLFWAATLRSPGLGRLGHEHAESSREVALDRSYYIEGEAGLVEDLNNRIGLLAADLDENSAIRRENLAGAGGDSAIGVEPVGATCERCTSIVPVDLICQGGELGGRDARRIRDDEVEFPVDADEPIAGD